MFTDGKWRFLVRSWRYRDGINSNRTSVRSNRNQLQRANSTERNLSPGLPLPHPPNPRLVPRVRYPAIMQHEELPCRLTQQRNGSATTRERKKQTKVTQNGMSDVASCRVVSRRVVSCRLGELERRGEYESKKSCASSRCWSFYPLTLGLAIRL